MSELIARSDERDRLWMNKFEQLPGTHISALIQAWGDPKELENNEYLWSNRQMIHEPGGYVFDGYTKSTIRDRNGYFVGTIRTPKERYVEPSTFENDWCEIRITTHEDGTIIHASHANPSSLPLLYCPSDFPFPEE
jgi:hypothetical protein